MNRSQINQIKQDLAKKMVFIVGPRQVGKTWLSKEICKNRKNSTYLNYDSFEDRITINRRAWENKTTLLVLDELHKMPKWKNFLKGVYDTKPDSMQILVTGSARLDTFRQAGDSLTGRFFKHRLLPLSLTELQKGKFSFTIDRLMDRGGFPEPFLAKNEHDADRWRQTYVDGLIREDILDFERIHDFTAIKIILNLLRRKVGSPISYNSLAQDASISPKTAKRYIKILEALFIIFSITPYSKRIAKSIKQLPKYYFFDTGLVIGNKGIRFENMVAVSLLKHSYLLIDQLGKEYSLNYIRTKDGKEIDFCFSEQGEIKNLIEVKYRQTDIHKSLYYFSKKLQVPSVQIVKEFGKIREVDNIKVCSAEKWLEDLKIM